jgi:hypothetical protein
MVFVRFSANKLSTFILINEKGKLLPLFLKKISGHNSQHSLLLSLKKLPSNERIIYLDETNMCSKKKK